MKKLPKTPPIQVADLLIAKRMNMPREDRKVDGLISLLRKVANDLENGRAVECDFKIDIDELNHYLEFNITLQTFHMKAPTVEK